MRVQASNLVQQRMGGGGGGGGPSAVVTLTDENFDKEVGSDKKVTDAACCQYPEAAPA